MRRWYRARVRQILCEPAAKGGCLEALPPDLLELRLATTAPVQATLEGTVLVQIPDATAKISRGVGFKLYRAFLSPATARFGQRLSSRHTAFTSPQGSRATAARCAAASGWM